MEAVWSNDRSRAAMRSPINWALLGLLMRRASYGYELMQRFEQAYPGTLELSSRSQVYTALDSLARHGLIESTEQDGSRSGARQQRVRYRPTAAGVRAYEQWLTEQISDRARDSGVLAQHVAALGPEEALVVLERCAQLCLETIGDVPSDAAEQTRQADGLADRLAGEDRRLRAEAVLSWIDYARSELRASARKGPAR